MREALVWAGVACPLIALAASASATPSAAAPAPQQAVDGILAEATARSKAGVPAAEVEAWIAEQMQRADIAIERAPPPWDVYGQARWVRDTAERTDTAPDVSARTDHSHHPVHD